MKINITGNLIIWSSRIEKRGIPQRRLLRHLFPNLHFNLFVEHKLENTALILATLWSAC